MHLENHLREVKENFTKGSGNFRVNPMTLQRDLDIESA